MTSSLSEAKRKRIFAELIELSEEGPELEQAKEEVAAAHGLSLVDLNRIQTEGVAKEWPPLF